MMKRVLLQTAALSFVSSCAFAVVTPKDIVFENARLTPPKKGTNVSAAFVKVTNNGADAVELKVVSAAPYKGVEMHETISTNGMTSMKHVESVKLAPHQSFEFKPGASHIMLFDPTSDVTVGQSVPIEFSAGTAKFSRPFKVMDR